MRVIWPMYVSIFFQIRPMSEPEINTSKRKKTEHEEEKWTAFSREQLVQRCQQLEKHVEQLRNTISKGTSGKATNEKKNKPSRPFDFSKHGKRHIFLKFFYLGWDYQVRVTC